MSDKNLEISINHRPPSVATQDWRSDVAAAAYSAKDAFVSANWQEKAEMAAAVGIVGLAVARHMSVHEVAKAAEVVVGHNSTIERTLLTMAKKVDNFVFDLDSTLTDYHKASGILHETMATELHAATGLPHHEIVNSLYDTQRRLGSAYFYRDLNQIDGIRKYYPDADLNKKFPMVSENVAAAYHGAMKARPDTVELFDFLKSKGKKIHVFTASPTTRALDKLTASGLEPYVDRIFTGGPQRFDDLPSSGLLTAESPLGKVISLGAAKEEGRGYESVVEHLRVSPERIAMTGDNLRQDVQPSKRAGSLSVQASWFLKERSQTIVPDLEADTPKDIQKLFEEAYAH